MNSWKGWPLERLMYLFAAVAFTVIWCQIYLFHGVMGHFQARPMMVPVIYTPLLVLGALWYVATRADIARSTFMALYSVGIVVGLVGIYFHLDGIHDMPGGYNLHNFAYGPPVLLALTYTALCILGVMIAAWPVKLTAPDFERDYSEKQATRHYRGRTPA